MPLAAATKLSKHAQRCLVNGSSNLSSRLREALYPGKTDGELKRPNKFRADIVSPNLCGQYATLSTFLRAVTYLGMYFLDDAIKVLEPSLLDYRHCDIIDIKPGAGLWSSKIHDILEPRLHVLVEPELAYLPFLKPLLSKPESRYRHCPLPATQWSTYHEIMENDILPSRRSQQQGPVAVKKSLLLLATLAEADPNAKHGVRASTDYFLNRMLRYMLEHESLHSYGAVRMLVWTQEDYGRILLPRHVRDRRPISVLTQKACEAIPVVGPGSYHGHNLTSQQSIWSARRSIQTSDHLGIKIPAARQSPLYRLARESLDSGKSAQYIGGEQMRKDMLRLGAWENGWAVPKKKVDSQKLSQFVDDAKEDHKPLKSLNHKERYHLRSMEKVMDAIEMDTELHNAELAVVLSSTEGERELARAKHVALKAKLAAKLSLLNNKRHSVLFNFFADGLRAISQNPTLLQWDSRPHEPLVADANEFWPRVPLMLVDFRPRDVEQTNMSAETLQTWVYLSKTLLSDGNVPISASLSRVAPGAAEALIPMVPALKDPSKGGRLDIASFRSRLLTVEMIDKLAVAYQEWPFKPDDEVPLYKTGKHTE